MVGMWAAPVLDESSAGASGVSGASGGGSGYAFYAEGGVDGADGGAEDFEGTWGGGGGGASAGANGGAGGGGADGFYCIDAQLLAAMRSGPDSTLKHLCERAQRGDLPTVFKHPMPRFLASHRLAMSNAWLEVARQDGTGLHSLLLALDAMDNVCPTVAEVVSRVLFEDTVVFSSNAASPPLLRLLIVRWIAFVGKALVKKGTESAHQKKLRAIQSTKDKFASGMRVMIINATSSMWRHTVMVLTDWQDVLDLVRGVFVPCAFEMELGLCWDAVVEQSKKSHLGHHGHHGHHVHLGQHPEGTPQRRGLGSLGSLAALPDYGMGSTARLFEDDAGGGSGGGGSAANSISGSLTTALRQFGSELGLDLGNEFEVALAGEFDDELALPLPLPDGSSVAVPVAAGSVAAGFVAGSVVGAVAGGSAGGPVAGSPVLEPSDAYIVRPNGTVKVPPGAIAGTCVVGKFAP